RRPAENLPPFCLRHAAGDRDHHPAALLRRVFLELPHAAELGIDLFDRLFTDVAGVEDDEGGALWCVGLDKTLRRQGVRHTMRIVDVHLAPDRFHMQPARSAHTLWAGRGRPCFTRYFNIFQDPRDAPGQPPHPSAHIGFAGKKEAIRVPDQRSSGARMSASRITCDHLVISDRIRASTLSGVLASLVMPRSAKRCCTSGWTRTR